MEIPSIVLRRWFGLGVLLATIVPAYLGTRGPIAQDVVTHAAPAPITGVDATIKAAATRYGVREDLIAAVIEAESQFNPRAVSPKGAQGLMQLMPATAARLGVQDPFDPHENITGGVRHLRFLMDRFDNDIPRALAAYNAGEKAVRDHGGVPPYRETRDYVRRIMRRLDGDDARAARRRLPSA
jgi:soluble lytic murein transglycosylase-like protein